jgi:hypothetical protein
VTVEPKNEYYDKQEADANTGDPMSPIVIAGDIPVYWKAANLTSIFYPNLYPNPSQHHPTQIDTPRRDSSGNPHH